MLMCSSVLPRLSPGLSLTPPRNLQLIWRLQLFLQSFLPNWINPTSVCAQANSTLTKTLDTFTLYHYFKIFRMPLDRLSATPIRNHEKTFMEFQDSLDHRPRTCSIHFVSWNQRKDPQTKSSKYIQIPGNHSKSSSQRRPLDSSPSVGTSN